MITPADIEYKEFTKAVRGYKEEEVDAFFGFDYHRYGKSYQRKQKTQGRVGESKESNESAC